MAPNAEQSSTGEDAREGGLVAWQWRLYPDGHADRANLAIHIATVPLFLVGTVACVAAPLVTPWLVAGGLSLMATAIVAQGRGHRREATRPVPFRGPLDVASRLFVEQWVTFPRYVLSGAWAAAWRRAREQRR